MSRGHLKIVLNVLFVFFVGFAIAACDVASIAQRVSPTSQASSSGGSAQVVATPNVSKPQNSNPKVLIDNLMRASTREARVTVLLDIMRALDIGVRKSDTGAAIVAGSERSPNDFYLYDWELQAMSAGLERKQMHSIEDIAKFLTGVGKATNPNSQPISAETVRQTLEQGVQSAANSPQDPYSIVLLLVRELGMRHDQPYDLLKDVPAQQLQFDAVQTFLITTDMAWPALHKTSFIAPSRWIATLQNGIIGEPVAYIDSPCTSFGSKIAKSVAPMGKYVAGLAIGAKWATGAAVIPLITDMISGEMLAYSVKVHMAEGNARQFTHYGPVGHTSNAGKELRFHFKVEMVDDYGNTIINCGPLLGMTIPKPGGIAGVSVIWETRGLEKHGTISYDPANQKTGPDGVATLIFQPKDEVFPGMGLKKDDPGSLTATALYQSAFGNIPGSFAQFMFPKYDIGAWDVERHAPRGFKFSNLQFHAQASGGNGAASWVGTVSGHVCGEDPYSKPWDIDEHLVTTATGFSGQNDSHYSLQFTSDGKAVPVGLSSGGTNGGYMQIITGNEPRMKLNQQFPSLPGTVYSPATETNQVPIEEDTSCPVSP